MGSTDLQYIAQMRIPHQWLFQHCELVKFIYSEHAKNLQNLHCRFDWHYVGQIYGGDIVRFCGLLRIYELYQQKICH